MRIVVGFVAAFLFGWLLTGQVKPEPAIIAAGLAVLALAWWRLVRSASRRRIATPPGGHLAAWARAVAALPRDTARVGAALARSLAGRDPGFRAPDAPFHFGVEDDARESGRRAVALVAGSLTPDRIVVDVSPHEAFARTHRLAGGADPDREWLT